VDERKSIRAYLKVLPRIRAKSLFEISGASKIKYREIPIRVEEKIAQARVRDAGEGPSGT